MEETKQLEEVNCVASGYEWVCPDCDMLNEVISWTEEPQTCRNCGKEVKLSPPQHALE